MTTISALPNSFPYNELLLRGKLSAKTRTWKWKHTGLTLLYTSTSTANDVVEAYGFDSKLAKRGVLVGVGELLPVRRNTLKEICQIQGEFFNDPEKEEWDFWVEIPYRYEFKNLRRFKAPILFKPPRGAIRTFRVPIKVVSKSLKEIGVVVGIAEKEK